MGERAPSGIAVFDDDGGLVQIGLAGDDAGIQAALASYVEGDCVVAIDAPLIVKNPTGQRPCETALNKHFHRFEAGAHPANTGKPEFAVSPRGARLADALGLDMDPRSQARRRAIEVYPHPATIALFRLGRTLKYKHKPGRSFELLQSGLLRLMDLIEHSCDSTVAIHVADHPQWMDLRAGVETATRKFELHLAEDPVDAVLRAYVARLADRRPEDVTIYGDFDTGYIVTPKLPADLLPRPRVPAAAQSTVPRGSTHLARRLARVAGLLEEAQRELAAIRAEYEP